MDRLIGIVSLIGFICALVVHTLTFVHGGIDPEMSQIWFLHLGIFVVFLPFVISMRSTYGSNLSKGQLKAILPRWANMVLAVTFVYAFLNFALFFMRSEGGSPAIRDGVYVLQNHGKVMRELTEPDYKLYQSYVVRGFSGHWLVFYLVPSLYFLVRRRETTASPANGP